MIRARAAFSLAGSALRSTSTTVGSSIGSFADCAPAAGMMHAAVKTTNAQHNVFILHLLQRDDRSSQWFDAATEAYADRKQAAHLKSAPIGPIAAQLS